MDVQEQYIQVEVTSVDHKHHFQAFIVYGLNTVQERKQLWIMVQQRLNDTTPTVLSGDFNAVLHHNDRLNGRPITQYETRDFQDFIDNTQLNILDTKGPMYTWNNKGEGDARIATRIDRIMVNNAWVDSYQMKEAQILNPSISDHSPILFKGFTVSKGGGRPFRFLNCIASHPDFLDRVKQGWQIEIKGCNMYRVWEKLKKVKHNIKQLHHQEYGDIQLKIEEASKDLNDIQSELSQDFTNLAVQKQEAEAIDKLNKWNHEMAKEL